MLDSQSQRQVLLNANIRRVSGQGLPVRMRIFSPRWNKVLGDIWGNKLRAMLVILAITLGTFAVGTIAEARIRMLDGLNDAYQATNPFNAVIAVPPDSAFGDELVQSVERIPGVRTAAGRTFANVRLNLGPDQWADLQLQAVDDWEDIPIGKFKVEQGVVPPDDRTMLIERSALSEMLGVDIAVGDELLVETLDQQQRTLRLVGSVHDLSVAPTFLFGDYYGYITVDTLEWLGESPEYTQLIFSVDPELAHDREAVSRIAREVSDKVEKSGREVSATFVPPEPDRSPIATFILDPLVFLLGALGILMSLLSGFLVTNTISGLISQQIRQIGVLKAIGARTGQIAALYLGMVAIFGFIAFMLAVPLAHIAAGQFSVFFARFLNFDAATAGFLPGVLMLQLVMALGVPLVAALLPVLRGAGITIRAALDGEASAGSFGSSWIDRLLQAIRGLPRPLMLSLRNTFRRKGRLALTLTTLTLAGAIFVSVSSVQASIDQSLATLFETLIRYDIEVSFDRPYRIEQVEPIALQVADVAAVESIGAVLARRERPDGTESDFLSFQGLPPDSSLTEPRIVQGRWLLPGDENAIAVSANFIQDEGDLQVGDEIILQVQGREAPWRVVGVFQGLGNQQIAYANYPYFAREVREAGQTREMRVIVSQPGNAALQQEVAGQLEAHFRERGLRVSDITTATTLRERNERQFNIITLLLTVMAVLIALVGGLGLAGTMSINVLERTREVGVMRAIGASDGALLRLILFEGVLIGLLSWGIGTVLGIPLSRLLSNQVGLLFTGAPLVYTFSAEGVVTWLLGVVLLSVVASWLPAWNATRLTVREVLAYEG